MGTSMTVPQLSKEYLSDMCCVIDASMVVMFNFISRVLTFDFYSGFDEFIMDMKEDQRFNSVHLNYSPSGCQFIWGFSSVYLPIQ